MQRVRITRISSYAQKVAVVLARRAIMIVNMIHGRNNVQRFFTIKCA